MGSTLRLLAQEPPFRLIVQKVLRRYATSVSVREAWDVELRPAYLTGVLRAAKQAKDEGRSAMTVVEFGVAGGVGLVALQRAAELVEDATGITMSVVGFDAGAGLPTPIGDHRDHPDIFRSGDYPMDEAALRRKLTGRTRLVIGKIEATVPTAASELDSAVGFISIDVDLYTSTRQALELLVHPAAEHLRRCYLYFDDVEGSWAHRRAGELLAIEEFNENGSIFIDRWRGISNARAFPNATWHGKMYVAHDLEAIGATQLTRDARVIALEGSGHADL